MKKFKKYLCLILVIAIVFNFACPSLAAESVLNKVGSWIGETISSIGGGTLLFISSFVSMILGAFFGVFLYLEAQIIDFMLSPANFPITTARIVAIGWGITRDLANMFFILILLIIAFATVLKIQSYAIKQLWWKMLAAALLVNFSLVIAGFIIDIANILTQFFLNAFLAGGNFWTFTTKMMSNMQILNFYNPASADSVLGGFAQFGASGIAALVGIVLTLLGLVVTVFVFGAAAIFLMVRILYLWLLLIFAPIVWILWILPATSNQFSKWWDHFIQWAFFAPIFMFMIYLSDQIFTQAGKLNYQLLGVLSVPATWTNAAPGLTTAAMPAAIFQWILVIMMMFGSLIVAQKFGVHGATGARKILTGWGESSKNWAGRYARRKGVSWAQPLTEKEKAAPTPQGLKGKIGAAWRKTGAAIGGAAVAIPGARIGYQKMLAGQQKSYQDSYNKYKNIDPAILQQTLESGILLKPENKMALQSLLIEKGKLKPRGPELIKILDQAKNYGQESNLLASVIKQMDSDMRINQGYSEPIRTDLIKRAKAHDLDKAFRKFFPALASKVLNKDLGDEMKKIDNLTDIYEDQLEIPDVVKALPTERLNEFLRKASIEKRRIVKDIIDKEFESTSKALGVKDEIGRIAAITHRDTRNKELKEFTDTLQLEGFTPEKRKELSDLTRRKFAVEAQIWDTTI